MKLKLTVLLASAMAVAACSDDNSSRGPAQPTPTPTVAVTPTPAPILADSVSVIGSLSVSDSDVPASSASLDRPTLTVDQTPITKGTTTDITVTADSISPMESLYMKLVGSSDTLLIPVQASATSKQLEEKAISQVRIRISLDFNTVGDELCFSLLGVDQLGLVSTLVSNICIPLLTATSENLRPEVTIDGDLSGISGAAGSLTASATDPDGDSLTFSWTDLSGPSLGVQGETTAVVDFTFPNVAATGVSIVGVTVSDGSLSGYAGRTIVTNPVAANNAPVVNAGDDQEANSGAIITLSGVITDADGNADSSLWAQIFPTEGEGSGAVIESPTQATTNVTLPTLAGDSAVTLVFELTAEDQLGATGSDKVAVVVNPLVVGPTPTPTAAPTTTPTVAPTATPTAAPTATPTVAPTVAPTATPTVAPTATPTAAPTATPTVAPTVAPTATPTVAPTATPTVAPTVAPTATPTVAPTATPTVAPTATPTPTPTPTSTGGTGGTGGSGGSGGTGGAGGGQTR